MKTQTRTDYIWVACLSSTAVIYCALTQCPIFDASVLCSGILCVTLIAVGRKAGYIPGLFNSFSYAYLAHQNGLFGEVLLNLLFFVPTGVLGFLMWNRHAPSSVVEMRQLSWPRRAGVGLICLFSIAGLGLLLGRIPTQNTPYVDATTNVLSVIATFLMMWRFKEQWVLYMLLNVISVIMWILRWQADGIAGDTMIVMWLLFLANSIYGYWRWSKGARACAKNKEPAL